MTDEKRSQESSLEKLRDELAYQFVRSDDAEIMDYYSAHELSYKAGFDAGVKAAAHIEKSAEIRCDVTDMSNNLGTFNTSSAEPIPVIPDITLKPGDYVDQYECPKCGTTWAVSDPKLPCPTCEPTSSPLTADKLREGWNTMVNEDPGRHYTSPTPPSEQIDMQALKECFKSKTEKIQELQRELAQAREERAEERKLQVEIMKLMMQQLADEKQAHEATKQRELLRMAQWSDAVGTLSESVEREAKLVEALERIRSGMTTDLYKVEEMTKREAHEALEEHRKARGTTGGNE